MIRDQHIPIMTKEIFSFIDGKKNLSILDCTFGRGGHSKKFLESGKIIFSLRKMLKIFLCIFFKTSVVFLGFE